MNERDRWYTLGRLLTPDLRVRTVADVPIAELSERGIEGVMIDMDDTLLPSHAEALDPRTERWFGALRDAGIGAVIVSNGEPRRTRAVGARLDIAALPLAGKPFRFAFRRGLDLLGTAPAATAMIGDQLFTDVLGANLAGVTSILVRPLSAGGLPHTRWARRLERRILARHDQEERGSRGRTVHR